MKKFILLFPLFIVLFSCKESKDEQWKEKINRLEKEIVKKDSIIKAFTKGEIETEEVKSETKKQIQILGTVDRQVLTDTIELNPLVIFKREVKLTKLAKGLSIEDLGSISEFKEEVGYKVFSICNGKSLPIEMCNCTHNIYVAIEPDELGEPFELLKLGLFYKVELKFLGQKEEGDDMLLTLEHGNHPRKILEINLTTMKFL